MTNGWKKAKLGEITSFAPGYSFSTGLQGRSTGAFPFIKVSDMNAPGSERVISTAANWVDSEDLHTLRAKTWPVGTVIFPKVGAALLTEKRRILGVEASFDNNVLGLVAGPRVLPDFLYALMCQISLGQYAQRGAVPSINHGHVRQIDVLVPPLAEQRRIVDLIGGLDNLRACQSDEHSSIQRLLNSVREEGFRRLWREAPKIRLNDFLDEVKRPVEVDAGITYDQIGIRSHGRGIFTKDAIAGGALGSKKVYWVEPGDLAINIVFAWEGAVAVVPPHLTGFCASHRFPTYRRNDGGPIDYVRHLLLSQLGLRELSVASPGGAGRNRTLNRKRLAAVDVPYADLGRQQELTEALNSLEQSLEAATAETEALRSFRMSLLRELLSGLHDVPESYDAIVMDA